MGFINKNFNSCRIKVDYGSNIISKKVYEGIMCRASQNCGGQVAFVFRLPLGQVDFSGKLSSLAYF